MFDTQSDRLETVRIYLISPSDAKLILVVNQIAYNQPIDPAVFHPELPANVTWIQEGVQPLPDNERYAAMTAEQAARAFFEALGRKDWDEAAKFSPVPFNDGMKNLLCGLEVVSIGKSFTSAASSGSFVPYEIKLSNGETIKRNLSLKKDPASNRWYFDGGL